MNPPAAKPLTVRIPPAAGGIGTLTGLPASRFIQRVEKSGRTYAPLLSGFIQRVEEMGRLRVMQLVFGHGSA